MKNFIIVLATGLLTIISFGQNKNSIDYEIKSWTEELSDNQIIGPPCIDDYNKWMEDNPKLYWGQQKISEIRFDFNNDGEKDCLAYFPAVNCVGGMGYKSDFAIYIYSNEGKFLTNQNLTKIIEGSLKTTFQTKGIHTIRKIYIAFTGISKYEYGINHKTINGDFSLHLEKDANCCPSYRGIFKFNLTDFTIKTFNE